MAFLAKQPYQCIRCDGPIAKGEPITWTRGKGAVPGVYHVTCPGHQPIAVSFAQPETFAPEVQIESDLQADYDDDMPEPEPDPLPGTRAWFEHATMEDREYQIALGAQSCDTRREFTKLVIRYSRRLAQRDLFKLRRYARGVWAGLTIQAPEYADTDQLTLALYPEPINGETDHSRMTQTWRELMPALQAMPA